MRYVFILCNALDDLTRKQRGIYTDSPAASKKVIELCKSIQGRGSRCFIISLGRGKAEGPAHFFSSFVRKIDSAPIIYTPFSTIPLISELVSLLAPLAIIFRFRSKNTKAIIFYNPMAAYIPTLIFSAALGFKGILDLEDGHVPVDKRKLIASVRVYVERLFDFFCKGGALLACDALAQFTSLRPTLTYYGVANDNHHPNANRFKNEHVRFLFAGTLERETGAELLIEAINAIRIERANWADKAIFEITGKGPSFDQFVLLSRQAGFPRVIVHGRTTNSEYQKILNQIDVGLSLKLPDGPYANTTFPSKVMEFAVNKVLVLTTIISDVQKVFGESGALYVKGDVPNLQGLIRRIVENPAQMTCIANEGHQRITSMNSVEKMRKSLTRFIFEGK
jgi:glycosyltransferase involved in cell wall biosynthesis